jgi:hypothetical protein
MYLMYSSVNLCRILNLMSVSALILILVTSRTRGVIKAIVIMRNQRLDGA